MRESTICEALDAEQPAPEEIQQTIAEWSQAVGYDLGAYLYLGNGAAMKKNHLCGGDY